MAKTIGYATGVFDMFHIGHLNILRRARSECDYLIVGVTTDELATQRKGRPPIVPFLERMEVVENLIVVDDVVPQATMDKMEAWRNLGFDVMFVGSDWQGSEEWNSLERDFAIVGVRIVYFPYTQGTSSTNVRKKVFDE